MINGLGRGAAVLAAATGFLASIHNLPAALISATPIAMKGDPAPGSPPATTFAGPFIGATIGTDGVVAASMVIEGPNVGLFDTGLWMGASKPTMYLARPNAQAAGLAAGITYSNVSPTPSLSGQYVGFGVRLSGPGVDDTNDEAAYLAHGNSVQLLVREGDAAPGVSGGANIRFPYLGGVNRLGQVGWAATVVGPGVTPDVDDSVIYVGPAGAPQLVARSGAPAPGVSAANFQNIDAPALNTNGKIVTLAWITGAGINQSNDEGIWGGTAGSLNLLARTGDHAPGAPAGVTYKQIPQSPYLNETDHVAFIAELDDATYPEAHGLFTGHVNGPMQLVMRSGEQAAGMASGMSYYGVGSSTPYRLIDGTDKLLIHGQANNDSGDVEDGLWYGDADGLELIARSNGADYQLGGQTSFDGNADGFLVWMQSPAGTFDLPSVWVRAPDGSRRRLLGPGDFLDLGGGDVREIDQAFFGGNTIQFPRNYRTLSDDGLLALTAIFRDGSSGMVVVNVLPEPSAGLTIACAAMLATMRRRKMSPRDSR